MKLDAREKAAKTTRQEIASQTEEIDRLREERTRLYTRLWSLPMGKIRSTVESQIEQNHRQIERRESILNGLKYQLAMHEGRTVEVECLRCNTPVEIPTGSDDELALCGECLNGILFGG